MTHARKATSAKSERGTDDTRVARSRIAAVSGQFLQKATNCEPQRPAIRLFPGRCRTDRARTQGSMRDWWSDARHFQIVALSSLLAINFVWLDFGAKPLYSALAISSALATQVVCSRYFGLSQIDLRSPLITGPRSPRRRALRAPPAEKNRLTCFAAAVARSGRSFLRSLGAF